MPHIATATINPMTGYQSAVRIKSRRLSSDVSHAETVQLLLTFDSRHMWLEEDWRNEVLVERAGKLFDESLETELNLVIGDTSFAWRADVRRGSLVFDISIYGPAIVAFLAMYPKVREGLIKLAQDLSYLAKKAYYAARWIARFAAKVVQTPAKSKRTQPAPRLQSEKSQSVRPPSQAQAKPKVEKPKYLTVGATSKPRRHS